MSKQEAIARGLKFASKQSKERCEGCKWYTSNQTIEGKCSHFNIIVKEEQVCDIWSEGYGGDYNQTLIREYQQKLKHSRVYTKHAEAHSPWPTQEDLDSHFITRYFVKYGSNQKNPIIEVSEQNYKIVDEQFYHKIELEWKINGPPRTIVDDENNILDKGISVANRDTVVLMDKQMPGLRKYLIDMTELAFVKDGSREVGDKTSTQQAKKKSVYGSGGRPAEPESDR